MLVFRYVRTKKHLYNVSNLREPYDRTFRHNYIYCRYRLIALALARVCDDYSIFISLINISGYKIVDFFSDLHVRLFQEHFSRISRIFIKKGEEGQDETHTTI